MLVGEAAELGVRQVVLAGGEPLLHPDILELLDPPPAVAPEIHLLRNCLFNLLSPA